MPGCLEFEACGRLYRAISLSRGDVLDGLYDDGCHFDRERSSLVYLRALERLMAHRQSQGQWLAAISFGRQLLRKDPIGDQGVLPHGGAGTRPTRSLAGKIPGDEDQLAQEVGGAVRQLQALIARLEAARSQVSSSTPLRFGSPDAASLSRTDPPTQPIPRETLVHEHH